MSTIDFSKDNILFISNEQIDIEQYKKNDEYDTLKLRQKIEPWLTAIFQSEYLSLLVGNGLTLALGGNTGLNRLEFDSTKYKDKIKKFADSEAEKIGRGEANFEDDLRVATDVLRALKILEDSDASTLENEINQKLFDLLNKVLESEKRINKKFETNQPNNIEKGDNTTNENNVEKNNLLLLKKFLISFAGRTATRDRLNIFTTNYDRVLEYGLDEAGIFTLDKFIGKVRPIMRFHRIDLDYHYNPPGIRGEPHYVEGVVRFTKLHGSLDWRFEGSQIVKTLLPFGTEIVSKNDLLNTIVIYPNSSKEVETIYFPYSELFRDFSTAICRPNSVLVTYGYGFGDSHINRIIEDMLTIPSTHLVIISYDLAGERIKKFIEKCNSSQLTLIIGNHLGNFSKLVENYLPKPTIDRITERKQRILEKRGELATNKENQDRKLNSEEINQNEVK